MQDAIISAATIVSVHPAGQAPAEQMTGSMYVLEVADDVRPTSEWFMYDSEMRRWVAGPSDPEDPTTRHVVMETKPLEQRRADTLALAYAEKDAALHTGVSVPVTPFDQ